MSTKRADLQAVRGLAILAVLLFHFFPKWFPNGYVGVDQFFILSGFLMASVLSKYNEITFKILGDFYYRRLKRILPLYILFIFTSILFIRFYFSASNLRLNLPYARKALTFTANFALSNANILFTHCWSLSTEVQFYVIAPFIILLRCYVFKVKYLICLSLTGLISLISFEILMQYPNTTSFAFNSDSTRMWQFIIGILSFSLSTNEEQTIPEKCPLLAIEQEVLGNESHSYDVSNNSLLTQIVLSLLLILMIFPSFFPLELHPILVRLIVCFSTALVFSIGGDSFLSIPPLVYLGDISYSLYLIHWPIYVYIQQEYEEDVSTLIIGCLLSIGLAIFIYETFEKFYLKQEKSFIFTFCGVLFISSFTLIYMFKPVDKQYSVESFFILPDNLTMENVLLINAAFNKDDHPLLKKTENLCTPLENSTVEHHCVFKNLTYNGNARVMYLGNSYVRNLARIMLKIPRCTEEAKEITMMSRDGCEVLADSHFSIAPDACIGVVDKYLEAVNISRPDYLFIMDRSHNLMKPDISGQTNYLKFAENRLKVLETLVKNKIVILNALPRPNLFWTKGLDKKIKEGKPIDQAQFLNSDPEANFILARERLKKLNNGCKKCQLFDIMPVFTKNGTFEVLNPQNGLQYFTQLLHLTDYGLTMIEPVLENVCSNLRI